MTDRAKYAFVGAVALCGVAIIALPSCTWKLKSVSYHALDSLSFIWTDRIAGKVPTCRGRACYLKMIDGMRQSQKIAVAERAMAERNAIGQLS